jgi:integrase
MGKLTDRAAKTAGPGKHGDGDGLTLVVSDSGARKWVLRYQMGGKRRDMGLGSYPEISLSHARGAAAAARALAAQGSDPLAAREAARKASRPIPTFADIARDVIAEAQARTSNDRVAYQWQRHLGPAYSGPLLDRPVNEITTVDVAAVLRPIWRTKPEVARKLYPAIRRVFEAARIRLRDEHGIVFANPALWDDLKAMGFEAPKQLLRGHHPSLPYSQMPAFMSALREREAIGALALEFTILTNVRTDALLAAQWSEIDLEGGVWTVPLANLKDKKTRKEPFRVPLSARCIKMLTELKEKRVSHIIFPNAEGEALSHNVMLRVIHRLNSGAVKWIDPVQNKPIVPHGFRASFRTWAEENSHFPYAVIEEAMGHTVGNVVERAYRRTDVLEQRRALMIAWSAHCEPAGSENVIFLKKPGGASA